MPLALTIVVAVLIQFSIVHNNVDRTVTGTNMGTVSGFDNIVVVAVVVVVVVIEKRKDSPGCPSSAQRCKD